MIIVGGPFGSLSEAPSRYIITVCFRESMVGADLFLPTAINVGLVFEIWSPHNTPTWLLRTPIMSRIKRNARRYLEWPIRYLRLIPMFPIWGDFLVIG